MRAMRPAKAPTPPPVQSKKDSVKPKARPQQPTATSPTPKPNSTPKAKKPLSKKPLSNKPPSTATSPTPASPPPRAAEVGASFSPYGVVSEERVRELLNFHEKLGDGNFADVLRATEISSGEEYAVKAIHKAKLPGRRERDMLRSECEMMRRLTNPNCIELYDVFETADHIYLVMEIVRGGDLFDHIVAKGKFPEAEAAALVGDLAGAVAYMHQQRIIHRDLKPENILVAAGEDGCVTLKLGDFGLSMVVNEPLHTVCGTPTYVAPEIIAEGGKGYGLEVDNWAIGVIMYILLCGFPPFSSSKRSQKELFQRIRAGQYSFPKAYWEHISAEAKHLIQGLLVVDPQQRITAAEVLQHPWITQSLRPEGTAQRKRRVTAKKRWLQAAAKLLRQAAAHEQQQEHHQRAGGAEAGDDDVRIVSDR